MRDFLMPGEKWIVAGTTFGNWQNPVSYSGTKEGKLPFPVELASLVARDNPPLTYLQVEPFRCSVSLKQIAVAMHVTYSNVIYI